MNTKNTSTGTRIRAGAISLLVFAIGYLWVTGISDLPRAWLFIITVAVCFVLMVQSLVDLLVLVFGFTAKIFGRNAGCSVRLVRRIFFT
jgi:hypothetical protein